MSKIEEYLKSKPQLTQAVVCYLLKPGQVLLGLRKKVALDLGKYLITGIGGKIENGESAEEAVAREVEEEIKVKLQELTRIGKVIFLFPNKPAWNQEVYIYASTRWEGEPTETEPIKPNWYSTDKLPASQMWEDNLYIIPEVLKGKKIDAIFLYDNNKRVVEYHIKVNE
ncbi:MAG: NUDIX domain-containing protein [Patescibacteria group bacterium]|nr:NUDIX domain-containing protein [Patescibacteria group bacterium]